MIAGGAHQNGVVLFDLDGTLVDADHLHFEAWRDELATFGVGLDLERYRSEIMGFPNEMIMRALLPQLASAEAQALVDRKEARFRELAVDLEPAPGLPAFLAFLERLGTRLGVVTNAPRENAELELRGLGLADRFATLVIAGELEHAKPHPMPYAVGLERLDGLASHSLAFEDSLSGLRSALAAGLLVVGLTTGMSSDDLLRHGASLAIADFADRRLEAFVAARLGGLVREKNPSRHAPA